MEQERLGLIDKRVEGAKEERKSNRGKIYMGVLVVVAVLSICYLSSSPTHADILIPSFDGPIDAPISQVYYSHYVSRIKGSNSNSVRTFDTILSYMREYRDMISKDRRVNKGDKETLDSIIRYTELYMQHRYERGDMDRYWYHMMNISRLTIDDMRDEIINDRLIRNVSLDDSNMWSLMKASASRSMKSNKYDTEYERYIKSIMDGVASRGINIREYIDRYMYVMTHYNDIDMNVLGLTSLSYHVYTHRYVYSHEDKASVRFMRLIDSMRILLPMDGYDHMYYRILQIYMYNWTNYRYLKYNNVKRIVDMIDNRQVDSNELVDYQRMSTQIWRVNNIH